MNTNYIKTKEAAYVTDDAGKMKEIPMTNMTQILLVEENKEESLRNLMRELEQELKELKKDKIGLTKFCTGIYFLIFPVIVVLTSLVLASPTSSLMDKIGGIGILVSGTGLFYLGVESIRDIKEHNRKKQDLNETLMLVRTLYNKQAQELRELRDIKATPIKTENVEIIHINEKRELLKFQKYLLALKLVSKRLEEYKKLYETNHLERYLNSQGLDREIKEAIIDVMSRTRTKK